MSKQKHHKWTEKLIIKELKIWIKTYGNFPTGKELVLKKKSYLVGAMYRCNGKGKGLSYFKNLLGYKARASWTDELIEKEINLYLLKFNRPPTMLGLRKIGRCDLEHAIINSGGINYWAKKMGFKINYREKGFWQIENNIHAIIRENFNDMLVKGMFPTRLMLIEKIGSQVCESINMFGGSKSVSKNMGIIPSRYIMASDGHYLASKYEYIVDEFLNNRGIFHEVDGIIHPSSKCRFDFKVKNYFIEVWGFNKNGKNNRCIKYNLKRDKKEKLYKFHNLNLISINCEIFKNNKIEKNLEECLLPVLV